MEGLHVPPLEEEVRIMEEGSGKKWEQEEGGMKASSPAGSTTADEETDEDSETESPRVVQRKVSFADAFGLNLVSVKEFDNAEEAESEVGLPPENEATHPSEDFYMSCLFTVPSSPDELDQRLQERMVELESIELLPGTTTLRGNIRVVNLSYDKSVYARVTLDRWTSYFDLLAEYVPGSSDRKTDRFTFKYTLAPPFERGGTRVEVCLRYETAAGTFWANNKDMNYVLFFHQKGHIKEHWPPVQEENISYKSKRSCLKANRRGSAEEKIRETSHPSAAAAEAEATLKAEEANRKDSTYVQSLLHHEEHKPSVESIKSRQRVARLARVRDYLSQRRYHVPTAFSHDSANGQKVSRPLPAMWGDSGGFLQKRQKKQSNESPQVLTYHQIPLLTLDWNNDKAHQWGSADMDDCWTGGAKTNLSEASEENTEDTASVNDMWETFRNGTDDTDDKETSVCDVWQAFLNGPSCTNHSAVPESEWLQTAASVSPSNDKEPNAQCAASSQEHEFQVGMDTPTGLHAHTSASCQLQPDTCQISLANVALNSEDQPAEARVGSPRDDNTATQDAPQRSKTNSVTGTRQEFCLKGTTPVSEGYVDSSTECHKHTIREREREGIIGRAEGIGRGEPFTPHTADLVTSSGESETTDTTATPESKNATAVDRISQGAGLGEGLSSGREEEVTGTAHNAMDDTMAFRGTIRTGTKDGERIVFSTSGHGVEEGIENNCTGNKVAPDEEIFRPQKTEECEISQRYADEKQHEEFRQNRNSENPLRQKESYGNEIRVAQTNADESNLSQIIASESEESQDVASNNKDIEVSKKTEVEPSFCTTRDEIKRLIGAAEGIIRVLNVEHDDKSLQLNLSIMSEVHNKQFGQIKAEVEECIEKKRDSTLTQIQENVLKSETDEHVLVSNQTEEGKGLRCDGIIEEQKGIISATQIGHTGESRQMRKVFQGDYDTFRPSDKCNQNPAVAVEMRRTPLQDDIKGQEEGVGRKIRPGDVKAKKSFAKKDNSPELQRQWETLERTEDVLSQGDSDEGVSIGELKIEVPGELRGNAAIPQGKTENAAAELKEQELSAEAKSSPRVEYKRLSEGTKYPITAENTAPPEVIESGLEETFVERFGEDLVRGIWEEVFGRGEQASNRDMDIVDGIGGKLLDVPDITQDCHLLFATDFNDAFDSGVFSLTDLPTDPNLSPFQGETIATTKSSEYSPEQTRQSLTTTTAEQTNFLSESKTDLNSSAHLSQDLTPILAAQRRRSLTEAAQNAPKEDYNQIKERSVARQETGRQIEGCVVAHMESFHRSAHPSHKNPSTSSDKVKEPDSVVWCMLYILSQIIKLLICALVVAGFFCFVVLYDFPTFFALYIFSLCWWFYKWKRHQVTTDKGMVR